MSDAVADQVHELLIERLVDPATSLLGLDVGRMMRARAGSRAERIAEELADDDRAIAARAAIDLAALLPDPIPPEWWTTPLGGAVARTNDATVVSQAEAARILGSSRAWVNSLVRRGRLETAPGGVTLASVIERSLQDANR